MREPEDPWRPVRFFARHCVSGVMAGWALMLGLLWTDVGQVDSLMARSPEGWIGLLMLVVAFGSTGAAVGMGVAIMTVGRDR